MARRSGTSLLCSLFNFPLACRSSPSYTFQCLLLARQGSSAAAEVSNVEDANATCGQAETELSSQLSDSPETEAKKSKYGATRKRHRGGKGRKKPWKVAAREGAGGATAGGAAAGGGSRLGPVVSVYGRGSSYAGKRGRWWNAEWAKVGNWSKVEFGLRNEGHEWDMEDCRMAWRRCVSAHLHPVTHNLQDTAACFSRTGRAFLKHLRNKTVELSEGQKMPPAAARDIGWAAGKHHWVDERFKQVLAEGLIEDGELRDPELPLPEVVPVIWGMANSGQYPEELFDMMVTKKAEILHSFNVQNCTNILWAMAVCGYHPGIDFLKWMSEFAAHLFAKSPNSPVPQAVSDLMWSLGRFGFEPEPVKVIHKVLGWAYDRLPIFEIGDISTTALGLAMCKALTVEDMRKLATSFRERAEKTRMPLTSVHASRMFTMTLLFPAVHCLELQQLCFGKDIEQMTFLHQEQQSQIAVQMRNNHFLQRIGHHLKRTGANFKLGALTADRNLAIELLVTEKEDTYAIIPVYPTSRNRNGGTVLLGETVLARLLIESQGLKYGGILEWTSGRPQNKAEVTTNSDTGDGNQNVENVEKVYS